MDRTAERQRVQYSMFAELLGCREKWDGQCSASFDKTACEPIPDASIFDKTPQVWVWFLINMGKFEYSSAARGRSFRERFLSVNDCFRTL